jgi:hypothetical protein
LPVQKLAGAHIGRDEDTIIRWKTEDSEFADQIENAKAEWALKNVKGVRSREWLLERLMNDHFADKRNIDLTSNGKQIQPKFIVQTQESKKQLKKLYERSDSGNE